jgi:hypothetical protein
MGCIVSSEPYEYEDRFHDLEKNIRTFHDLQEYLTKKDNCEVIVAIDFNRKLTEREMESVSEVIRILGLNLKSRLIHDSMTALGFTGQGSFPLVKSDMGEPVACDSFESVIASYNVVNDKYNYSPKNCAISLVPTIERAIDATKREGTKHVLIIITNKAEVKISELKNCLKNAPLDNLKVICVNIGNFERSDLGQLTDEFDYKFRFLQFVPQLRSNYQAYILEFAVRALCDPGPKKEKMKELDNRSCMDKFEDAVLDSCL